MDAPILQTDTIKNHPTFEAFGDSLNYATSILTADLGSNTELHNEIKTALIKRTNNYLPEIVDHLLSIVSKHIQPVIDDIVDKTYRPNFRYFPEIRRVLSIKENNTKIHQASLFVLDEYMRRSFVPKYGAALADIGQQNLESEGPFSVQYSQGYLLFIIQDKAQVIANVTDFPDPEVEA